MTSQLFDTVPQRDYLGFTSENQLDYARVADFLRLTPGDLSKISDIRKADVKFGAHQIPPEVSQRLIEIANVANLVAEFFEGDPDRTILWFQTLNPLLGGVRPRDMLRMGRYPKLLQFILQARDESGWGDQRQAQTA